MAVQPEDVRLLANHGFRRLLESRLASHVGQNVALYTLLILVVNETGSAIHSTILVTALILPSIVLGIPAGALADILPRRTVLVLGHAIRAGLIALMVLNTDDIWTIYLLVLAFSTLGQFIGPTEAGALRGLVRVEQLTAANSWMTFTTMLGQAAGAVVLAPLLLKLLNEEAALTIAVVCYVIAAFIATSLQGLRAADPTEPGDVRQETTLVEAIAAGWRVLETSRPAFLAMIYLTAVWTLAKALAVLAPRYTQDVLNISTENTVFVVAPAAIGAVVALLITPPLARLFGAARMAAVGFVLYVFATGSLGLVVIIRDFIVRNVQFNIPFVEQEVGVGAVDIVVMAMILSIPLGFAATIVGVAGKTVLNEEAPQGKQARVFATQTALSDALSLVPLFAIGGVAELVGVREVLLAASVVALVVGVFLTISRRIGPQPQPRPMEAAEAG